MRNASALIIVAFAILTAGCALSGKAPKQAIATPAAPKPVAAAPAPPPPPLSIPQTQVELPKPQPLDPAALVTEPAPPAEAPPETPAPRTQAPGRRTPAQPREGTTGNPPATTTPATTLPPAVTPPEATGPTIQEIIAPEETKRLRDLAASRRREAQQILDQVSQRQLSPAKREVIPTISSYIASSLEADKRGDVKTADALAERAQILAKDLLNAK